MSQGFEPESQLSNVVVVSLLHTATGILFSFAIEWKEERKKKKKKRKKVV